MNTFQFSPHALLQMKDRNIEQSIVIEVLNNPQSILSEEHYTLYQRLFTFDEKDYLVRVFVNTDEKPPRIITVYKTSK